MLSSHAVYVGSSLGLETELLRAKQLILFCPSLMTLNRSVCACKCKCVFDLRLRLIVL